MRFASILRAFETARTAPSPPPHVYGAVIATFDDKGNTHFLIFGDSAISEDEALGAALKKASAVGRVGAWLVFTATNAAGLEASTEADQSNV